MFSIHAILKLANTKHENIEVLNKFRLAFLTSRVHEFVATGVKNSYFVASGETLIGDPFHRSAYCVFRFEHYTSEISIFDKCNLNWLHTLEEAEDMALDSAEAEVKASE